MAETVTKSGHTNGKHVGVPAVGAVADKFGELGKTGLREQGGQIFEEFIRELNSQRKYQLYKEMFENSSPVFSSVSAILRLARQVRWTTEAADTSAQGKKDAEFLESNMNDMSESWIDTVDGILQGMIVNGWNGNEIVLKRRQGKRPGEDEDGNELPRSQFKDNLIGWRKLPIRHPETLWKWEFDPHGGIQGMHQQILFQSGGQVFIPIEKLLLFRTTTFKGNPEGFSALRPAYPSWVYYKQIQKIMGIGIERDLTGLPVMWVDPALFDKDAPPELKAALETAKEIVRKTKRDEQEGLVLPSIFDDSGNQLVKFELVTTGGRRQFNMVEVLKFYRQEIYNTFMASFLILGEDKSGSFSLSSNMTKLFAMAVGGFLDIFTEIMNRFAVPRLFEINGWERDKLPRIEHGDIETRDASQIVEALTKMALAGFEGLGTKEQVDAILEDLRLPATKEPAEL